MAARSPLRESERAIPQPQRRLPLLSRCLRRAAVAGHEEGVRHRGGDSRPVVAAQRAPRRHRLSHEGVPADGTWTSEQSLYNLAVRAVELELIPALRSLGIGLIPYSPLHAGLLIGLLETATEGGMTDDSTRQRSKRTATSWKRTKGCVRTWAQSRRRWRWPGCCVTLSSPPRSSERRRSRSSMPTSARCRCNWTPTS